MLGFHTAIKCYNWDVNVLASYVTYGCFCGPSGDGIPIDETDKLVYLYKVNINTLTFN